MKKHGLKQKIHDMKQRYTLNKEGMEHLRSDVSSGMDNISRRVDEVMEPHDPIYREKIHAQAEPFEDRVLVRGRVDTTFLLIVIAISLIGAIMAYSASSVYASQYHGDSAYYFKRHIGYLLGGFALSTLFVFVFKVRPWFWRFAGVVFYIGSVLLLLLVLVIGVSYESGATRWIQLGPVSVQPSEIAKMAVVMVIALVMSKHEKKIAVHQKFGGHFQYAVLYPMLLFGFICGLVALEHHLSGIIIIGMLGMVTMFLGGTHVKYFAIIGGVGLIAVACILLVSDYAMLRVTTWINIHSVDPLGSAWQTLQGLNAIGSGGFFGVGLGNSRQKYGYVSQPQNDFIFTIVCEEMGFIGAFGVVVLFGLLIWRGFHIASKAPDKFSALVIYGLTAKVALQTILNIAVVTNSVPNTGIALPFFSSGGTSLVLQIFEMGIILSLSRYSYQKR